MWPWRRRPATPAPVAAPLGCPVRVIGLLRPGYARVIVGPGVGPLDGGSEQDWPLAWVPPSARQPNGEFRIAGYAGGLPRVVGE